MRPLRILGLVLLVGPLLAYVLARVIVTDTEAVEDVIEAAVSAANHGDFTSFRDYLDEEFESDGRDRNAAARYAERVRREQPQIELGVDVEKVEIDGDEAEATARVRARPFGAFRVGLRLVRRADAWRIRAATLLDVAPRKRPR